MPIRVLSARRAGLMLALCLAAAPRASAKPPDLPQPTTADFSPAADPIFVPLVEPTAVQTVTTSELDEPIRQADQHAAPRRITLCGLIAFSPLFTTWTDDFCDILIGRTSPVMRDFAVSLFSGPFGSNFKNQDAAEAACEPAPVPEQTSASLGTSPRSPCGNTIPNCKEHNTSTKVKPCTYTCVQNGTSSVRVKVVIKKAASAETETKIRACMTAAWFLTQAGCVEEACTCYARICQLAPGTRWEEIAGTRIKGLRAASRTENGEEAAEQKDVQDEEQSARPVEATHVFTNLDVSDLVGEVVGANVRRTRAEQKLAQDLTRYIRINIQPESWDGQGGTGAIEYNPETNSLVIRHEEAVHQQVTNLLDRLRLLKKFGGDPTLWLHQMNQRHKGGEEPASEGAQKSASTPRLPLLGLDIRDLLTSHEVAWDRTTDTLRVVASFDPEGMSAELIRLIENGVSPPSWSSKGGPGRIEYNAELKTIFVTNTSGLLEDVATLIQARRRELQLRKERCEREVNENERKRRDVRRGQEEQPSTTNWTWEKPPVAINRPTVGKLVDALLQESHEALNAGKQKEAETLASCALAMDRKAVMEHPLVYKMQLLTQVFKERAQIELKPRMPAVDPGVVHAYNEMLQLGPRTLTIQAVEPVAKKTQATLLEVQEEASELEVVPETKKANGSCCIDFDLKSKRVRFQVQLGTWTIKLVNE